MHEAGVAGIMNDGGLNDWCMGEYTGKNGIGGWREQAARTDGMSGVEHDE